MTAEKHGSRLWRAKLRDVLNSAWDPIGVAEVSPDEYEGYAGKISTLVREGSSDNVIRQYLVWAEAENMGYGEANTDRISRTLSAIRALGPIP